MNDIYPSFANECLQATKQLKRQNLHLVPANMLGQDFTFFENCILSNRIIVVIIYSYVQSTLFTKGSVTVSIIICCLFNQSLNGDDWKCMEYVVNLNRFHSLMVLLFWLTLLIHCWYLNSKILRYFKKL